MTDQAPTDAAAPAADAPHRDVAQMLRDLLAANAYPEPDNWIKSLPSDITNQPENVQRFFINRYWRLQLQARDDLNTLEVRSALVEERTARTEDWLRVFFVYVMPFVLQHNIGVKS